VHSLGISKACMAVLKREFRVFFMLIDSNRSLRLSFIGVNCSF
jgi:hypothetical protein